MSPTPATYQQRKAYLSSMPKRRQGVARKLWRGPDLDMVLVALRELDPSSAPKHDGFMGAFYKAFLSHFALVMLDIIAEVGERGMLPESWCEGMTRCVPKKHGCIVVDKQQPITLLTCKIKWFMGVLQLVLGDLMSFVVPHWKPQGLPQTLNQS